MRKSGWLLHILSFLLLSSFALFPENWKQETTLGRFTWDVCGNTTEWGPWTFGKGYTDGPGCLWGDGAIHSIFEIAEVFGTIFIMPTNNLAMNGSWSNLTIGEFRSGSDSGYVLVENLSVRYWNGSLFELNLSQAPSTIDVLNSHVNYFYYNLSEVHNKNWVRNHSVFRGHAVNLSHFTIVDNFLGFARDDEDVFAIGEGNVESTNGTHFIKYVSNESVLEVLGQLKYNIILDRFPPVLEILGPTSLIAYGGCVNGTYNFSASDETSVNLTHDVNGSTSKNIEFCSLGFYKAKLSATDAVGRNSSKEMWILVGNATYGFIDFYLPIQEWTIPGHSDILWIVETEFNLSGPVGSELNFTLELPGKTISKGLGYRVAPWNHVENVTYSNRSMGYGVTEGDCTNYSFDNEIGVHALFKSPEYDPQYGHSIGFVLVNNSWKIFADEGVYTDNQWYVEFTGSGKDFSVCVSGGNEPTYKWCGDGICSESCTTCMDDCGSCGGSSGGGWKKKEEVEEIVEEGKEEYEPEVSSINEITSAAVSKPGSLSVNATTRVIVAPGLALSDGKRLFIGEVLVESGTYEIVQLTPPDKQEVIEMKSNPSILLLLFLLFLLI